MKKQIFICLLTLYGFSGFAQKNRVAVSYQAGYILERTDFSEMGLHLYLERKFHPNWSVALEWAWEDYCRCDLGPYRFYAKERRITDITLIVAQSSPVPDKAAISRFTYSNLFVNHHWKIGNTNRQLVLGTGLTYRSGVESFFQFQTPLELIFNGRRSSDWAIPLRLAYRYDPFRQWWGLTGYLLYQGYFFNQKSLNVEPTPIHIIQGGVNIDFRFGKREKLKTD